MVLCPIAIVAGCKKCPAFSFCPVKATIGDYKKESAGSTPASAGSDAAKGTPTGKGK